MDLKTQNVALVLGTNAGLRDSLRGLLKGMGMSILESTPSAKLALERLSEESVSCHLIVAEVTIEGMSCRNFLAELRTMPDFDETMVVLLASDHEYEDLEACLELGIAGVIKKPFTSEAFPELLQTFYARLKYLGGNHKALFLSTYSSFCESICRYKAAINYLEESIRHSAAGISHFELGRLYLKVKNLTQGEINLAKAVEINAAFKAPADKTLALYRRENPSDDAAMATAVKTFVMPQKQSGSAFYGMNKLTKVLVLGGTHTDRVAIRNYMGNCGIKNVAMHDNPETALKLLRDCDVGLVVASMRFSKGNALSLTKTLREIYSNKEMKILVIVEEDQTKELAQVLEAGADGFFIPPFVAESFIQRVHRCMLLQDLTAKWPKSAPFAKCAHAMYENGHHDLGQRSAEKGLTLEPDSPFCKLFKAINQHMQLQQEEAHAAYTEIESVFPALAPIVAHFRAEVDAFVNASLKKAKKPVKTVQQDLPVPEEPKKEKAPPPDPIEALDTLTPPKAAEKTPPAPRSGKKKRRDDGKVPLVDKLDQEDLELGEEAIAAPEETHFDFGLDAPQQDEGAEPTAIPEEVKPPPVSEAPAPEPAPVEKVALKRVRMKRTSLGEFASLSELQKEIFGKDEIFHSEVAIPKPLLDKGISEVDLVQPLGVEPIFGGIKVVDQSVVPWLPTESLEAMSFQAQNPGSVRTIAQGESTGSIIQISEQAQLLNSRIICLPDKHECSQSFFDYLSSLGKVVAAKDLVRSFKLDHALNEDTRQLLNEVKEDLGNVEKSIELGNAVVTTSIADDIFQGMARGAHDENLRKIVEESLEELKEPIVSFHRECLEGKKEFERNLPYVLEAIAQGTVEFEMLYKAMEQDHNSLEAFKKIYTALARAGKKEELDRFFNAHFRSFNENEKSRKALERFLLAMGDARRLKLISPKASVDEMRRNALDWYQKNDHEMTITLCKRLISRNSHLEFAYNLMGVAYRKMGRFQEAIEAYAKGLEIEPESVKLNHNISIAFHLVGDKAKSREASEKARILREARQGASSD